MNDLVWTQIIINNKNRNTPFTNYGTKAYNQTKGQNQQIPEYDNRYRGRQDHERACPSSSQLLSRAGQ